MKTLSVNDEITVNGLNRTIVSIRWVHPKTKELDEKDEVLWPALDWCILKTNKGELIQVSVLENNELRLKSVTLNGLTVNSNQYDYPAKTYYYISNKAGETYHHKDNKWRKKELKEMTTYAINSPETALLIFTKLNHGIKSTATSI